MNKYSPKRVVTISKGKDCLGKPSFFRGFWYSLVISRKTTTPKSSPTKSLNTSFFGGNPKQESQEHGRWKLGSLGRLFGKRKKHSDLVKTVFLFFNGMCVVWAIYVIFVLFLFFGLFIEVCNITYCFLVHGLGAGNFPKMMRSLTCFWS